MLPTPWLTCRRSCCWELPCTPSHRQPYPVCTLWPERRARRRGMGRGKEYDHIITRHAGLLAKIPTSPEKCEGKETPTAPSCGSCVHTVCSAEPEPGAQRPGNRQTGIPTIREQGKAKQTPPASRLSCWNWDRHRPNISSHHSSLYCPQQRAGSGAQSAPRPPRKHKGQHSSPEVTLAYCASPCPLPPALCAPPRDGRDGIGVGYHVIWIWGLILYFWVWELHLMLICNRGENENKK